MTLDAQTILFIFVGMQIVLLIFKRRARQWHFDSDKPYRWNELDRRGEMSDELLRLEDASDDKVRVYNFWFQVERLKREQVPGAFAELGVYRGETARLLHLLDATRRIHLFDTFTGFDGEDLLRERNRRGKYYHVGAFADTSLEKVQKYLGPSELLIYHPGHFPETAEGLAEPVFALVHLDADLYWPTLKACEYFYPLLAPGGVLIVHDYNHNWDGVRQAIDEFSATVPENLIEIADRQGSVMLIKAKISNG